MMTTIKISKVGYTSIAWICASSLVPSALSKNPLQLSPHMYRVSDSLVFMVERPINVYLTSTYIEKQWNVFIFPETNRHSNTQVFSLKAMIKAVALFPFYLYIPTYAATFTVRLSMAKIRKAKYSPVKPPLPWVTDCQNHDLYSLHL